MIQLNGPTYTLAISACAKSELWKEAVTLFQSIYMSKVQQPLLCLFCFSFCKSFFFFFWGGVFFGGVFLGILQEMAMGQKDVNPNDDHSF